MDRTELITNYLQKVKTASKEVAIKKHLAEEMKEIDKVVG